MLIINFLVALCAPVLLAAPLHSRQEAAPSYTQSNKADDGDEFATALANLRSTYEEIENEAVALRTTIAEEGEILSASRQVSGRDFTPRKFLWSSIFVCFCHYFFFSFDLWFPRERWLFSDDSFNRQNYVFSRFFKSNLPGELLRSLSSTQVEWSIFLLTKTNLHFEQTIQRWANIFFRLSKHSEQ